MKRKYLKLIVFLLVILGQWVVPIRMIIGKEDILTQGTPYKFKTEPIDPNDPFRGKYVALRFEADEIELDNISYWKEQGEIYVELAKDEEGFAVIQSVTPTIPKNVPNYVKASNGGYTFGSGRDSGTLFIHYPFDRYYMDEFKAPKAEIAYRESAIDSSQVSYALVYIKEGEAVIKDVFINDISIKDFVEERQSKFPTSP